MTVPEAASDARYRRIALLLEYDGTRYAGSQYQPDAPTIQGELEEAIRKTIGLEGRAAFAGRTDAGVHAYGQVAAFTTASRLPPETIVAALNANLPKDIAVKAAAEVPPDFDPRRSALRRRYLYAVETASVRPAIGRQYARHVPHHLDLASMREAAALVLGERDFAAFGGTPERPHASTIRRLEAFEVSRDGSRLRFELTANAFLRGMVRRLVGALAEVGRAKLTDEGYAALLDGPPSSAGPAAPAHGLFLLEVEYPKRLFDDPQLAGPREHRAHATLAIDSLPLFGQPFR